MVKYLIFGNGFLGNKFQEYFESIGESTILLKDRIGPITTYKELKFQIKEYKPEIVVNAIGKTGKPNVDWCEDHREETFFSNVTIPTMMAEICQDMDKYMVHIGSGCVYEGDNNGLGYTEEDESNFKGSFYSRTKIYSEQILKEYSNILQLRIRMPIDSEPSAKNLITKLTKYTKVINERNSVTCIPDLMKITNELIYRKETGIFNVANKGNISHKKILDIYREIVDSNFELPEFISVEELKGLTIAGRSNCVLSTQKLENLGIEVKNVKTGIRECMKEYKKWI